MTDLAVEADLEARLGRVLTASESSRATAFLADASALIRNYTRRTFTAVQDDVIVLRPIGTRLRLPQRPVTAVSSVVAVGWAGGVDITLPTGVWGWDGVDIIEIGPFDTWVINLPDVELNGDPDTYRVTYDHGDDTVPDDVIGVCCGMVLRVLLAPSLTEGMSAEHIGQYSYQMSQQVGGGSPGAVVRLNEQDKDALSVYRRKSGTIEARL